MLGTKGTTARVDAIEGTGEATCAGPAGVVPCGQARRRGCGVETRAVAVDWTAALEALRAEVARTVALLRSVRHPDAPAIGEWSAAEVAMHLSQAWIVVPGLARRDLSGFYEVLPDLAGTAGESLIADVWDLADVTRGGVRSDPERDFAVIASRIEERAEGFFAACAGRQPDEMHPWLVEGAPVTLCTLTCHLLNETVMHGADIAGSAGRPWAIDRRSAALIIQGFVLPVVAALDPAALVDQRRAAGVRATYELHLRGGGRFRMRFHDGQLRVEAPGAGRVDCHVSADPAVLLEVIWGRTSQWRAITTGRLVAWGRRPWLGPRLRLMIRNP